MVESLERNFEFPKILENTFETDDARYIGKATDLHFQGRSILGKPHFTKHLNGLLVPQIDVSAQYDHYLFIMDGKPQRSRTLSYREQLVYRAANLGIILSDDLFDKVFEPIEMELVNSYLKVFPPDESENARIQTISGEITQVWSSEVGRFPRKATFYTIVDADGLPHRVAIPGTQNNLNLGEKVTLDFDEGDVVAADREYSTIETLSGEFQVTSSVKQWFRVKGYKKKP